eukprot:jgi/Ulvmu1/2324/UM013_0172.1
MAGLQVYVDAETHPPVMLVTDEKLDPRTIQRSMLLSDLVSTHGPSALPVTLHAFALWRASFDALPQDVEDLRELLKVSMFLMDSDTVHKTAQTFAHSLLHASHQDVYAASKALHPATPTPTTDTFTSSYPPCLLLTPGPRLSEATDHILPLRLNEAAAVMELLPLWAVLPLPVPLRSLTAAAHIRHHDGTLDLISALGRAAPPATLAAAIPALVPCLPSCPPITHLRAPPGAFDCRGTLEPLQPHLAAITRITASSPRDAAALLSNGLAATLPRLTSIRCHACAPHAPPLIIATSPLATPLATPTSADPPKAHAASLASAASSSQVCRACPSSHSSPGLLTGPPPECMLSEVDLAVAALHGPLPMPASRALPQLRYLSVTAEPPALSPPHLQASPNEPAEAQAPPSASPSLFQLLRHSTQLTALHLMHAWPHGAEPPAGEAPALPTPEHVACSAAACMPQALRSLELGFPDIPGAAVAAMTRLTVLTHLGVYASADWVPVLASLPTLASLCVYGASPAHLAHAAQAAWEQMARAALKMGRVHTLQGRFSVPGSPTGRRPAQPYRTSTDLPTGLLCDLVLGMREVTISSAHDASRADAAFAADGPAVHAAPPLGIDGLQRLELPVGAFCSVVDSGNVWDRLPEVGVALMPRTQLRNLQEVVVRPYIGRFDYTKSDALDAVASLPALRRLVLGGAVGVCSVLRALRPLRTLTELSLPDAEAVGADAVCLAGAVAELPVLCALRVELDFPPALCLDELAGFKPRARDQKRAHAEAAAAVAAVLEGLRRRCWDALCTLQERPRPPLRLELSVSSSASDDFLMCFLSSGFGCCPRI